LAVKKGNLEMVTLLLANKANPDLQNNTGSTALHLAVRLDADDIVALLIEKGASVTKKDLDHWTPLFVAYLYGTEKSIPLLMKHVDNKPLIDRIGNYPIHYAAIKGYTRSIQIMLDAGMNVDVYSDEKKTALSIAATKGDIDLVKFLVQKGAKVDLEVSSSSYLGEEITRTTPLYLAIEKGNMEVAQYPHLLWDLYGFSLALCLLNLQFNLN
jgi:ankyrin repeat protein